MHAAIKQPDGMPGPLASWVKQVTSGIRRDLNPADEAILRDKINGAAEARFDEVLEIWGEADYGNDILKNWANALTPSNTPSPSTSSPSTSPSDKDVLCSNIAEIGVAYVKLLLVWPDYVWAIQDLDRLEAYWLFTRVRP